MSDTATPERFPVTSGEAAGAALEPMMDRMLGSRLVFGGQLDAAALEHATRLLLDAEPVLGCWYDGGLRASHWVRCDDSAKQNAFALVTTADPNAAAATFHGAPLGSRAPRFGVGLLRTPTHDELLVRLDHAAGDGWSAQEATYLLGEIYDRLLDDPDYVPIPHVPPRPTHRDVWEALSNEQREVAKDVPPMGMTRWIIKTRPGTSRDALARAVTLPADLVERVRAYAHTRGATVNEALIAALIRSAAAITPPKPGVRPAVSVSANPRRFVEGERFRRITMISTTQTPVFDYAHGETFEQTLQHVVQGVQPYRDCLWSVGAGMSGRGLSPTAMYAMFWLIAAMMRLTRGAALATMNFGPFDESRLDFGGMRPVTAVSTGIIPKYSGFATTISMYQGALTLWMGFREKYMAAEYVERYLGGVERELVAAVAE